AGAERKVVRLHAPLQAPADVSRGHQRAIHDRLGRQYAAIFEAHALLLEDPTLLDELDRMILKEHFAAEYAVSRVMRHYVKALEALGNGSVMASRVGDLHDLER